MRREMVLIALFVIINIYAYANNRGGILHPSVIFILEAITANTDEEVISQEYLEEYTNYLSQVIKDPFDLNSVTHSQLSSLYILDNIRILAFLHYRESYGFILSVNELELIPGFSDSSFLQILLPFFRIGDTDKNQMSKKSIGLETLLRFKMVYPKSLGYTPITIDEYRDNPNSRYIGTPEYLSYRVNLSYSRYLFNIFLEKDPGEKYFDMIKGNFIIDNVFRKFKSRVIVGSYNARFGEGLVLWNGFKMDGNSSSSDIYSFSLGINHNVSSDKCSRFNGVALDFSPFKSISFNIMCSIENKDAIITDGGGYSSIITSGYHNRQVDIKRKGELVSNMLAFSIRYDLKRFSISYLASFHKYSHLYDGKDFGKKYLSEKFGRESYNSSLYYKYLLKNTLFFGEYAIDRSLSKAFVNGLVYNVKSDLEFSFKYLHIDKLFHSSISDVNRVSSTKTDRLKAIVNYKIDKKSSFSCAYNLSNNLYKIYLNYIYNDLRYSCNLRLSFNNHAMWLRLYYNSKVIDNLMQFSFKGDVSKSYCYNYQGYIDLRFSILKEKVNLSLRASIFDVSDWYARIYSYERDLLYLYTNFVNYGRGVRGYFFTKVSLSQSLVLWLKLGLTHYLDRDKIGEGPETILSPSKFDFKFQIKYSL